MQYQIGPIIYFDSLADIYGNPSQVLIHFSPEKDSIELVSNLFHICFQLRAQGTPEVSSLDSRKAIEDGFANCELPKFHLENNAQLEGHSTKAKAQCCAIC